jgi:DNA repair exonuclease SbcCD ATPase subunit
MRNKIILGIAAIALFLSLVEISLAEVPIDLDIIKKPNPAIFEAAKKMICEKRQGKIEEKIVKFEERKVKHMEAYNNLQDRLEKLSDRLSSKGYDVTDLDADINILEEKISQFETDFTAAYEKMKEAKKYMCDNHTSVENKNEIKSARDLIKKVRQDSIEIRSYYKNTIRLDILAIKKQIPSQ